MQLCYVWLYIVIVVSVAVSGTSGQVEECPQYCSPVNNNYGPACATVGGAYRTFPNLCELYKERCANRRFGGPVIEFAKDGPCTAPIQKQDVWQVDECPKSCSPTNNNNNSGPVCAAFGNSFKTFPNLCELYKQRCANRQIGGPVIEFAMQGSCSTPVQSQQIEGQFAE